MGGIRTKLKDLQHSINLSSYDSFFLVETWLNNEISELGFI